MAYMKKRIFAAFLWFYVFWYAGALLANFIGVSQALGPIIGATAAALFVGDPRRIIWANQGTARPTVSATQEPVLNQ